MKRVWALMFVLACHATTQQLEQTFVDAAKDGACIAAALLGGTDPLACANATEALVIDIANDVEDKQAATLTHEQKVRIDGEKIRMATKLAQKAPGK